MRNSRKYVNGKTILISTIIAVATTILLVYLTGLTSHRTVLENSFISLTILAIVFFLFLTVSLYNGLHINDDLSHKLKLEWRKPKSITLSDGSLPDMPVVASDDGISGILISVVLWIVMAILFILFLILLEFVFWAGILALIALIYWILIRALKLIFSKSIECQSDLLKSIRFGVGYTLLYVGWIYGVIYLSTLF